MSLRTIYMHLKETGIVTFEKYFLELEKKRKLQKQIDKTRKKYSK